jgi:DNA gyrase subunit A
MKQDDDRGNLVGGFIVVDGDEVLAIKQSGQVTRSAIDHHLRPTSRDTKGVKFVGVSDGDAVAVVARSVESALEHAGLEASSPVVGEPVEADAPVLSATIDDDADTVVETDAETEEP